MPPQMLIAIIATSITTIGTVIVAIIRNAGEHNTTRERVGLVEHDVKAVQADVTEIRTGFDEHTRAEAITQRTLAEGIARLEGRLEK